MKPELWQKPVFFSRNRVFRVYLGGELFRDFLGDKDGDNSYPEEWVASSVHAINPGHTDPLEGISLTEEGGIPFHTLLEGHPQECLGARRDLGVLVKFLDSAIRLPMQVHPSRAFSQQHFGSPYGKAEAWLILATRPDACIYFGFKNEITYAELSAAVDANETNPDSLTGLVNRIPVQEGDVFFVPAGMIHAIGAGCLLLEVQEPTDFTIQPEFRCGEYRLNAQEMYLGLSKELALSCFDLSLYGEKSIALGKKEPIVLSDDNHVTHHRLIGPEDTPCFRMDRWQCRSGSIQLETPASIYIVTKGQGTLCGPGFERPVTQGDYFFLPAAAKNFAISGELELVCCAGG